MVHVVHPTRLTMRVSMHARRTLTLGVGARTKSLRPEKRQKKRGSVQAKVWIGVERRFKGQEMSCNGNGESFKSDKV